MMRNESSFTRSKHTLLIAAAAMLCAALFIAPGALAERVPNNRLLAQIRSTSATTEKADTQITQAGRTTETNATGETEAREKQSGSESTDGGDASPSASRRVADAEAASASRHPDVTHGRRTRKSGEDGEQTEAAQRSDGTIRKTETRRKSQDAATGDDGSGFSAQRRRRSTDEADAGCQCNAARNTPSDRSRGEGSTADEDSGHSHAGIGRHRPRRSEPSDTKTDVPAVSRWGTTGD